MNNEKLRPTYSGVPANWLIEALLDKGIKIEDIQKYFYLSSTEFGDKNNIISAKTYNEIFEWSAVTLSDSCLGIHVAEKLNTTHFGLFGYLLNNATTLGELCDLIERFHIIFSPEFRITFQHSASKTACYYWTVIQSPLKARQDIDFTLATIINYFRKNIDCHWHPDQVYFSYERPLDTREHLRIFGKRLRFGHLYNGFEFDRSALSTPIKNSDSGLLKILQHQADQFLYQVSDNSDFLSRTKIEITIALGQGNCSIKTIATKMNISTRKLHRNLNELNSSFRELRNDLMLRFSENLLLETNTSITQISHLLGYSETSAFVRVFKRLKGITPLQYRKHKY
jgi:AraC-like DNA-binding protein